MIEFRLRGHGELWTILFIDMITSSSSCVDCLDLLDNWNSNNSVNIFIFLAQLSNVGGRCLVQIKLGRLIMENLKYLRWFFIYRSKLLQQKLISNILPLLSFKNVSSPQRIWCTNLCQHNQILLKISSRAIHFSWLPATIVAQLFRSNLLFCSVSTWSTRERKQQASPDASRSEERLKIDFIGRG